MIKPSEGMTLMFKQHSNRRPIKVVVTKVYSDSLVDIKWDKGSHNRIVIAQTGLCETMMCHFTQEQLDNEKRANEL